MVSALRHEQSYVCGTWMDESLGLYVGWVARSGPHAQEMPLCNERGDLVLLFSGEDFREPETVDQLRKRGHSLPAEGPEYLVHLAEEDSEFPRSLNGRFQGVLVDAGKGTARLFNDRYGMQRVYFHEAANAFYFAAEAKAILAVRRELRSVDPDGLAQLISCGCTLGDRTVFKNIQVLPPASAWTFRRGAIVRKCAYFDSKEWEEQSLLDPESYYKELRRVFTRNLPRYFEGPERVGVSLTGGLDTRMIMSWHKASPGSLPCYSFGGMYRDSQDVLVARRVAQACGQPHEVISVGEQFLERFPHYAERTVFLTDGCVDVKHAPDLYVNERARKIAPVRMTGNYGGEVLRHIRAFRPVDPMPGLFQPEVHEGLERAKETYGELTHGHPLSFAVFRQAPWHHYGLLSLEQTQLSLRSPYLDNEFVRTVFRAPESAVASDLLSLRMIADGDENLRRIRTDRGLGGSLPRLGAAVQRAHLTFTFKAEYAFDYGMPQAVARADHALAPLHLEKLFLGRHKFYHFRTWYRNSLSSYVRDMLLDSRTLSRPYLKKETVEHLVTSHLRGEANYTTEIHKLLTLEHLHRLFIDAI
jgi:asparagine synthase (glutamine-hydrolysing)